MPSSIGNPRDPLASRSGLRTACVLYAIVATGFVACDPVDRSHGSHQRQAVEVLLPGEGLYYGSDTAKLLLLEFGSFACPLCRRFHLGVFPLIDQKYVRTARVRFRYVDVSPPGPPLQLASVVDCLASQLDFPSARSWAYKTLVFSSYEYSEVVSRAAQAVGWPASALRECADSVLVSSRRAQERAAARELRVPGTPTFIIGIIAPSGRVVGWPVVGLAPFDSLARWIEEAEAVVRPSKLRR